ncbi:hypothetical protein ACFV2S_20765 [Streptomyces sp. NPDC059695]|uniref:hypothetical protein n=1 Tax=Streptomyces sp. NPDC059695 TaxID=3346910 RepID=UPI003694939D
MRESRTVVNRTVLAVFGLALLLGGTWLAGAGTALAQRFPSGWPAPGSAFLGARTTAGLREHGWWTPAVVAAGTLVTLLLARWAVGRIVVRRRSRVPLPQAGGALSRRALETALAQRALTIAGIGRCRPRVHTRGRRLHLRLRVWLEPGAGPDRVVPELLALTAEAARAAAPYEIGTRVRISHLTRRTPHVR